MTNRPTPLIAALFLLLAASAPSAARNQLDSETWMNGMVESLPSFSARTTSISCSVSRSAKPSAAKSPGA